MKNYYTTLGIIETSDLDAIKSAYRKLAVKYHPDKSSNNSDKFREISEAYDTLKDPLKKKEFDSKLKTSKTNINPARVRRGSDVTIILKVTSSELLDEVKKTIVTTRSNLCSKCNTSMVRCNKCNGSGIDAISIVMGPQKYCSTCKGYGNISEASNSCMECKGSGLIKEKIQRTVALSRSNFDKVIIKESGDFPVGGGQPGDLIVSLKSDNKKLYEMSGKNIRGTLPISPAQAVLGDTIFIDVFDNNIKVVVPKGTKHGFIIEQQNVPVGSRKAKLFLRVNIVIPKSISAEEEKLYLELLRCQKGYI
jgi:molecular chaperone DnaJ